MQESILYFYCVYNVVVKKVHVRYLIFWWVSCYCTDGKMWHISIADLFDLIIWNMSHVLCSPLWWFSKSLKSMNIYPFFTYLLERLYSTLGIVRKKIDSIREDVRTASDLSSCVRLIWPVSFLKARQITAYLILHGIISEFDRQADSRTHWCNTAQWRYTSINMSSDAHCSGWTHIVLTMAYRPFYFFVCDS